MTEIEQLQPDVDHDRILQSNVRPSDWINPVPNGCYNLVVVGAGTAGLVTAAGAAGLGAKVALVERGLMGGDCLNFGCVPSKALIATARQVASVRDAENFAIQASISPIDFAQVMRRMRRLRASLSPHDSAKRFRELGVDVYFGQGAFASSNSVTVGNRTLRFTKAVIATGARATIPPIPGLQEAGYLSNETLFSLTDLPNRLVVIGGGPIGCEMAQSFARFGSCVTIIEQASHILPREEQDAALIVQKSIQGDGVDLVLGGKVIRIEKEGPEKIVVVSQDRREIKIRADQILISLGRTPNLDGLELGSVGVASHPQRGIEVNDRLQTSNRNIFAAGDVCSKYKFTHAADFLARIVIQNSLFMGRAKASKLIIPWCTYTSPEIAHVGIFPDHSADQSTALDCYSQPLSQVDRAVLDGEGEGFLRVYCKKGSDKIVGATVVATRAGDIIGEIVMAMKNRIGLRKIASVIHPYPTQAEAIRKLGDQFNRSRLTPRVKSLLNAWLRWNR